MSNPGHQAETMVFRFGEFTFDCSSHLLLRGDAAQHLSPKARGLLRLLLLARPRALSRQELYDALWPSTFVCETNLANVVSEVRSALGDTGRKPHYIRTVHGFGYAFDGSAVAGASNSTNSSPINMTATLSCDGQQYPLLEGDNLVGRAPGTRVVLTNRSVSRRHALVRVHDGAVSIHDLGSTNGSYVDGRRIGTSPVQLTSHSHIELGAVTVSIQLQRTSSTGPLWLDTPELRRLIAERTTHV
jgi:DNA-binding winged helix-turn-helix (wHTH) protein